MSAKRLLEIQYKPGEEVVFRFNTQRVRLLPESTRGHLRNANKEFLLALRTVLDRSIERMEGEEGEKAARPRGRQRVRGGGGTASASAWSPARPGPSGGVAQPSPLGALLPAGSPYQLSARDCPVALRKAALKVSSRTALLLASCSKETIWRKVCG